MSCSFRKKVLLIDADPQANATSSLVLNPEIEIGTYQLIEGQIKIEDLIIETTSPNLKIVNIDLVGIEIELVDKENRKKCF